MLSLYASTTDTVILIVTFLDFEDDDTIDYSFKKEEEEENLESESSEFSAEAEPLYEYHYDDELGDYIAISSPSSAEAEYHPDYEEPDSPCHNTAKRSRNEDEDNMHDKNNNKKKTARVWSQDDEITLLQALYEYAQKKRANPVAAPADMNRFYNSFKKSFHRKVTRIQVATKVRKLRKKFKDNIAAGKTNLLIKDNKTHDQNVYQLSNDIWGLMDLNSKCVVNNKLKMKSTLSFEGHGMDAFVKKCGLSLRMFEGDTKKKAILEERWNKFKLSQLDASRRQAAFKRKLMQFALESFQ